MNTMRIKMTICFPMHDGETIDQAEDRLIERIDPDGDAIMSWNESEVEVYEDEEGRPDKEVPAVDAAPVVHGRPVWINPLDPGAKICTWKCSCLCSVCRDYVAVGWKYCPSCGAKMDGERKETQDG